MKPYIIIVAGIPASGKTTYAQHIAEKLHIPFIGKDAIKEKLYDVIKFDTSKIRRCFQCNSVCRP